MVLKSVQFEQLRRTLACLTLAASFGGVLVAQSEAATKIPATGAILRVTHILGFERVPNNAEGDLSIEQGALRFQKREGSGAQISISSIREISLGEEDKQVGGVPMAIGRTAAPFGGGRVVGLFSHKKYDTLTVEYVDVSGAFHGAIFQLDKGLGQALKNQLVAARGQSAPEAKNESH